MMGFELPHGLGWVAASLWCIRVLGCCSRRLSGACAFLSLLLRLFLCPWLSLLASLVLLERPWRISGRSSDRAAAFLALSWTFVGRCDYALHCGANDLSDGPIVMLKT